MNSLHYKKFVEYLHEGINEQKELGSDVAHWWNSVSPNLNKKFKNVNLPSKKLSRQDVKNLCKINSGATDLECAIAIMCWGGQNRKHAVILFNRFEDIQPIIRDMRLDKISHLQAYDKFYNIWITPKPLGMGAAYFTKLIFFCQPDHKGYIMDQWTSKSINLLKNENVVHLSYNNVSKRNMVQTYKRFCELTDDIAQRLKITGEQVETAMFSRGGRNKWGWRKHVIEHTKKT